MSRSLWLPLTLLSLSLACGDDEPADDSSAADDTAASDDTATSDDTDSDTDTNPDTDTPAPARLRFVGVDFFPASDRVAFTARLDDAPITAGFDAGVLGSETGWIAPGAGFIEVPAGSHEATLAVSALVSDCPGCEPIQRDGSASLSLELAPGEERMVLFSYTNDWSAVIPVVWTVDDTRARPATAVTRLVGGPRFPNGRAYELWATPVVDGCPLARQTFEPAGVVTELAGPNTDDADYLIGMQWAPVWGDTTVAWYTMPDRTPGEALTLFQLNGFSLAPATEGALLPLTGAPTRGSAECVEGPSR